MNKFYLLIILITTLEYVHAQILPDPLPSPVQSGSYIPGIIGVRDFANPGFSGIVAVDYNLFINSDKYVNRNGDQVDAINFPELGTLPIDVDLSGYINSLMLAYASPELSFLGNTQYMFFVAPNYITANVRVALGQLVNEGVVDGGASGFGDLAVAPLFLSWGAENQKVDITGGYMFVAPTGRYETGADDNIGLGYWSHIIQVAGYYYPLPQKATAILVAPVLEFHGKTKDVDVKAGTRFALDYGISQYLSERFEVTLQGGHVRQIGEDSGNDVYWDTSVKDRMNIFGAGVGFWPMPNKFYTHFKWSTTYGNRQHFKVNTFELELLFIPWVKQGPGTDNAQGRAFNRP